jgi:hypothetical protein
MNGPRDRETSAREGRAMRKIVERLREQFPELTLAQIEAAIAGRYEEYADVPIRDFVPILVERHTRSDLVRARRSAPPDQVVHHVARPL